MSVDIEDDWREDDPCDPDNEDFDDDDSETDCRQKRLAVLVLASRAALVLIIQKFLKGTSTAYVTHTSFKSYIADAHAKAAVLGRQKAGDNAGLSADDVILGKQIAETESKYLDRFIEDLQNGRYTDNEEAAIRRAKMYTDLLRGTSNRAFVTASLPHVMFRWILGANENHCDDGDGLDCPSISVGGINGDGTYPASELPTTPGEGDTPCLGNCLCDLEREDGVIGFGRVGEEETE